MNKIFASLLLIFITQSVFAEYITEDIISGCDSSTLNAVNNITNMIPVWTINQYTCSSGQFLPAYTLGCQSCPSGYVCNGGTFDFNETETQGLENKQYITQSTQYTCSTNFLNSINNITNMIPVFTPNQHTCSAGYYLPANVDTCTQCLAGNKCVGGTYTFNETETQGIESCNGSFAPVGSAVCYDHILHIGNENIYLRSTKLTTPSLNVAYGDRVFYANATTTPTPITAGSQHYLKVIFNDQIYYICDDTACPQ